MKNRIKLILLSIFILSTVAKAQDTTFQKSHRLNFQTQFFQIKEAANYGLVFNGLNLVFGYDFNKKTNSRLIQYSADLAMGIDFKKGPGINGHLKPVDLFYGFQIDAGLNKVLYLGPYLAANYQWQLYPEVQSGHMFWFTFIDVGPKANFTLPIKGKEYQFTLSNSIAGFASRPLPSTETYYYSLAFSDFVQNAHSNLKFGAFNLFNHTQVEIERLNLNEKGLALAYAFEYFGYYENPELNYLTHSIILRWYIGKHK